MYNLELFDEYVKKGLLRKSEDEFLVQYNYTDKCSHENLWDEVTTFNRGNIYEKSTGKLIAKAMPKFFNFSQLSESEQNFFLRHNKFICTEKKDGCLGIIYMYNNEIRCNSRGGFDNYVTDVMKKLIKRYRNLEIVLRRTSLNVEVIAPQTKIVCNYGSEENLYLISAFTELNSEVGNYWQERTPEELDRFSALTGMPRPKYRSFTWNELFTWSQTANHDEEGFVVTINNIRNQAYDRVKV